MRTLFRCTGVATAILVATACGGGSGGAVHEVHADYPFYRSAAELTQAADVVVTATAKKVVTTRRMMPEGIDVSALPAFKRAELGLVVTDVTYSVGQVHKGSADATIVVTEIGGKLGKSCYVDDEEPNSKPGQTMLLVLRRGADGNYTVVGVPQGRYLSVNGSARAVGTSAMRRPLDGMSVTRPNLSDATPVPVPPVGQGPAVTGNGGKPALPGPPPGP